MDESFLRDSNAVEKIAALNQKDAGLAGKIKQFIGNMLKRLRELMSGMEPQSAEGKIVSDMTSSLEKLYELWTDALIDAGEAYSKSYGNDFSNNFSDVRYSTRETLADVSSKLASISDEDYLRDRKANPFVLVMEHTPKIVLDSMKGSNDRKILIRRDALYLAIRENGIQEGHYHGLGDKVLAELPKYLETPDVILSTIDPTTDAESQTRRLVLTHIPVKNGQAIISIEFETIKDFDGGKDYYNLVVTVFDLHENYLKRQFEKFGAKVKYQKEDLTQSNPQLFEWLRIINAKSSTHSISRDSDNVNKKFAETEEKFSDRDPDAPTNRELLVNALETDNMSPSEKGFLTKYKNKLSQIEANEAEISRMKSELKELQRNGKGKSAKAISLENKISTLEKQNNVAERLILNLEVTKPIRDLIDREKAAAYKEGRDKLKGYREKVKEREKEIRKEYQESRKKSVEGRHKTEMRHKIQRVVSELDKLLCKGNKERNVKLGLQDAVAAALEAFDINAEKVARYERDTPRSVLSGGIFMLLNKTK